MVHFQVAKDCHVHSTAATQPRNNTAHVHARCATDSVSPMRCSRKAEGYTRASGTAQNPPISPAKLSKLEIKADRQTFSEEAQLVIVLHRNVCGRNKHFQRQHS